MSNKEQPYHIENAEDIVRTYANKSLEIDQRKAGDEAPILKVDGELLYAEEVREAINEFFQE